MSWDITRIGNPATVTLTNGNKTATATATASTANRLIIPLISDFDITAGEVYWETVHVNIGNAAGHGAGIADPTDLPNATNTANFLGGTPESASHYADSGRYYDGASVGGAVSYVNGDVVGHHLNMTTGEYRTSINDGPYNNAITINNSRTYSPCFAAVANGSSAIIRTMDIEFTGTIPPGADAIGESPTIYFMRSPTLGVI